MARAVLCLLAPLLLVAGGCGTSPEDPAPPPAAPQIPSPQALIPPANGAFDPDVIVRDAERAYEETERDVNERLQSR